MKQTINETQFKDAFKNYGRDNQFSPTGLRILFEHLESLESDLGQEIELDVIGLCCDFNETNVSEIKNETGSENLEDLKNNTIVLEIDDETIIYQAF